MKRYRLIFTALVVFAVVGSALAVKGRGNPNILFCNLVSNKCVAPTTAYSTVKLGFPVTPPSQPYTGALGAICNTPSCPVYKGLVYINP